MSHYRELSSCRVCGSNLRDVLDLGETPIANNLCATQALALDAPRFPLKLRCCTARDCGLYQLSIAVDADVLYGDYTYATPDNPELEEHYERAYSWILDSCFEQLETTGEALELKSVVEIGSNNGAFLRFFEDVAEVVGVDPSPIEHKDSAMPRLREPFTRALVEKHFYGKADLIIARHCLAHIDDVHEILQGVSALLFPEGLFYVENAYWIDSMLGGQFDQVYHEHMSYFTLGALEHLLRQHGMRLVEVNFSEVHGGSLMVLAAHQKSNWAPSVNVPVALRAERAWLFNGLEERFVVEVKKEVSRTYATIMAEVAKNNVVDAYGASAKAVTRLAAAAIGHGQIRQCVDDSPLKQGKFLPGSGIPIVSRSAWNTHGETSVPSFGKEHGPPDAVYLTAWNYERSFRERERVYLENGGRFIR